MKMKKFLVLLIAISQIAFSFQEVTEDIGWLHFIHKHSKHYLNDTEEAIRFIFADRFSLIKFSK
jgi:hypothetical protein